VPTDPRQRAIGRLLSQLVGGEAAAFFLDACRMMDGDYRPEATTHLVGHLLRELHLSLRDVLRPIVPDGCWPKYGSDNSSVRQVDALCDALRIPAEDAFRAAWREFAAEPLHMWAHRYSRAAPRPVDREFRELWDKAQAVLYTLARRIEANYAATLPIVDELAAGRPDVPRLQQKVLHSTVVLDRFFDHASREWFELLRDAGYFADPPALVYEADGSVAYTRWPQGRYLARVAPEVPGAVIEIGLSLTTDNPAAQEAFLDVALALPAPQAARLLPKVEEWLATTVQWGLPFKAKSLVTHLIAGGLIDEGLALLRTLLEADHTQRHSSALAAEILRELTPVMFPAAGVAGVQLYADLLESAVAEQTSGIEDYSSMWRPDLATGHDRDLRDALVSALTDATVALVDAQPKLLAEVLALLETRQQSIFRRLALALLAHHPDAGLIAARLTDQTRFLDHNAYREYGVLAQAHFATLDQEDKQKILGLIEAGPEHAGDEPTYLERWRWQMLSRLPTPLPGKWQGVLEQLIEEYGAPKTEQGPAVRVTGVGSPLTSADLKGMSVEEILAFLAKWVPQEGQWNAPSRAGLARVMRQFVAENPAKLAGRAAEFARVERTYLQALLGGLSEARKHQRGFPWPGVLALAHTVVHSQPSVAARVAGDLSDEEPTWRSLLQEVAGLIASGLSGEDAIPPQERERVWQIISCLAENEDPIADDDDSRAPGMLVLSGVRCVALDAAVSYCWWLRDIGCAGERHLPAEARVLLEQRLDPATERSLAVHSVYGKGFLFLARADPAWAHGHLERIFPPDDERRRRVAFNSYLIFNRVWENSFSLLAEQYGSAIERLAAEDSAAQQSFGDVGERLVQHLMVGLTYGLLDFGDGTGLLEKFYATAPLNRRARALEFIGQSLSDAEMTDGTAVRLQHLGDLRLGAINDSGEEDAGAELAGFAWWFASGKLDTAWSLSLLEAALTLNDGLDADHVIVDRLAAVEGTYLPAVLRCLELLIDSTTRPWFVFGAREQIEAILVSGLAAGGEAGERARDIANRLVARGHTDYERMLQ